MGLRAVAAVLEEAASIARRHRPESSAHRLYERLVGTCPGSPQQRLELCKRFLDGIEIGRIGWQIHELAVSPSQSLPSMSSRTQEPLWEERLSITTTCPGRSDGTSARFR